MQEKDTGVGKGKRIPMKTFIALAFLLLSQIALAQSPRPRLHCTFESGYFRVTDGYQRWEKYIGTTTNPVVDCGSDYGIGAAGPYFVTFYRGVISEKYIGGNGARSLLLRGHMGIAVYPSYLIVAKAGGQIIEKYIGGNDTPVIEASGSLAMITYGSYLYVTNGTEIEEKYIGTINYPVLSVGRDLGAALLGSYLLVYANGNIQEKYIGSRSEGDMVIAGRQAPLIAVATSNYFIVFDVQRNAMKEQYIGNSGRVEVRADGAYHFSANSRVTRYDLQTGNFSSL